MANTNKKSNVGKKIVAITLETIKTGKLLMSKQLRLEKMHIEVLSGTVLEANRTISARKALNKIVATIAALKEIKKVPIADMTAVASLYDKELRNIEPETLAVIFASQAKEFKGNFEKLSKEQEAVVDSWYGMQARKSLATVSQIREVLKAYGFKVEGTTVEAPATVEEPAMAEAEG